MKRESSKRRESSGSFQLVTISGPIKWWTVSHVIVSNNQCCEQECSNSKDLNNKSWFNGVKIVLITGRVKKVNTLLIPDQALFCFQKTNCSSSISRIYNHPDDCQQGRKDLLKLQHEIMCVYIWTQPRRCSYLGSYIWTQPISCYLPARMPSAVQ